MVFETEARRDISQVRRTEADVQFVEKVERERPRRAREYARPEYNELRPQSPTREGDESRKYAVSILLIVSARVLLE